MLRDVLEAPADSEPCMSLDEVAETFASFNPHLQGDNLLYYASLFICAIADRLPVAAANTFREAMSYTTAE